MILKLKYRVLLLFCCLISSLNSSEFSHELNRYSGKKLKTYFICGERCSGTNFINSLINSNFPGLTPTLEYGHKHFLRWFEISPGAESVRSMNYGPKQIYLEDSDDCLFVFVVRDVYDWLRSFYLMPHYVHNNLKDASFIRKTWKLQTIIDIGTIDNFNPFKGKPFKNVMDLRAHKSRNYMFISNLVENYLLVRYEEVAKNPEGFLDFLSKFFSVDKSRIFNAVTNYKGAGRPYVRKKYFPFSQQELNFVNQNVDWEIEAQVGYFPRDPEILL